MVDFSKGFQCVIGGFLVHLVLGTLYCWGNFTTYVTAHLRIYDPSVTYERTIAVYSCALAFQGLFMSIGGLIERRIGARRTVFLGGYLIVLGTLFSAMAKSLAALILSNGVMFGMGMGIAYSSPISCAIRWEPKRKSLYSGIIVAGFGGGAFVFGLLGSFVVNPDKVNIQDTGSTDGYYKPDSAVPNRVPMLYYVLSICYFILITIGGILIQDTPEEHQMIVSNTIRSPMREGDEEEDQPGTRTCVDTSTTTATIKIHLGNEYTYQHDDNPVQTNCNTTITNTPTTITTTTTSSSAKSSLQVDASDAVATSLDTDVDMGPRELVRSSLAWHLALCLVLTAAPGMFLAGTYKTFGEQLFPDEEFLSVVGSVSALFNTAGRIGFGALADYIGTLKTLQCVCLYFSLVVLTYTYSSNLGAAGFAIWTFMMFACEGCNFALYPSVNVQLFGSKYASVNYGLMFSIYSLFCVINITVLSKLDVDFYVATSFVGIVLFAGFLNLIFFGHRVSDILKSRNIDILD
eukprot:gene643-1243_t